MSARFALHLAASTGKLDAIDLYLRDNSEKVNSRDLNGRTPMYVSLINGQFEALDLLLKRGGDINIPDEDGNTMLHVASVDQDKDVIEYLIEGGSDTESKNKNGSTPLHLASLKNAFLSVDILLENGAKINNIGKDGNTPLIDAVISGKQNNVRFLLERGADTEIKTMGGFTALQWSVMVEDVSVMRLLLKSGSDVLSTDDKGHTSLHRASSTGNTEYAKILMENGADVNAKGKTGKTPKDFAKTEKMIKTLSKKNIDILKMEGFDAIMQDDITVLEYLQDDPRNIVIIDGETVHLLNVRNMANYIEDAIVFPCKQVGNISPENVETDFELYNMRTAGVIMPGYITASTVRDAITDAVRSNQRVYTVSGKIRSTPAIVNQKVFEGRSGMVSANHCQAGADGIIRDIIPIMNVSGVPTFESLGDEFTETSMSIVINAYIIVKGSLSSPSNVSSLKSKIISDAEELMRDPRSDFYSSRVSESRLFIDNLEHMKVLNDLISIFRPSINAIDITVSGIEDFSFIRNITGLKRFSSGASLNTWSAIQNLRSHQSETLESLNLPVNRPILSTGGFPYLKSLVMRGFDEYDGVFEFIRGIGSLEKLTLISRDYSKSLDVLSTLNLVKLTLSLNGFNGDISPVSNNVSLVELDMYLPNFTGSLSSLSILEDLVKLNVTTNSEVDIDMSGMVNLTSQNVDMRFNDGDCLSDCSDSDDDDEDDEDEEDDDTISPYLI